MERYAPPRGTTVRRKKKKGVNTVLLFFILGMAVVLGLVVYLAFFRDREGTLPMSETPLSPGMTYLNTGKGLLYSNGGEINLFNWSSGTNQYFGKDEQGTVRMSGSSAASAVFDGGKVQIIMANDDKYLLEFTGTIDTVELGTGHIALLRRDTSGNESVLLYTIAGEQIDQILPGDQYVVDFGFYTVNGTEMFWVELLNVTAGQPTETIRCYDLTQKSMTGVISVQNQLVEELYITTSSIFVSGTNQILRYTHDGLKETYRVTDYGYRVLDFSRTDSEAVFLLTPRGGDMHSVKLLRLKEGESAETTETYLQLPSEGVAGFIMNGQLVVVSENRLYKYTMKGKLSETALFQYPVTSAEKLSNTMLLLESGGKYYTAAIG